MVNNNWIYFKKQKWDQKTKMEQQQRNFIRAFDSLSRNGNNKSAAYIRGILRSVAFPMLNNVAHTSSSNGVLLKKLFIYGFIRYN